jgi:hypothetical protein
MFDGQAFRQRIVRIANQELARWGNGTIKETDPRIRRALQDYWKTGVGRSVSEAPAGRSGISGKKRKFLERGVYLLGHADRWRGRCFQT